MTAQPATAPHESPTRKPLVSVCVPTYNYARFLRACIESVLTQTLADWELIICDDYSNDDTAEIVREYAKRDSRIRYIRNDLRLGMNGNIKRAADAGNGKYLKVLCSDDWLVPDCLEQFTDLMEENPQVSLATSAEILSNESGQSMQVQFLFGQPLVLIEGDEMLRRMARGHGFGGHSSFFIRRSAYDAVGGYDDQLLYASDYDLAARLCRVGEYAHLDTPLFYGRVQSESSSSVNPRKLFDVIDSFNIPGKIFQPRRIGNREWRRYQLLTGKLTARYLVNIVLQSLRGETSYARQLTQILLRNGNFWLGPLFLIGHIPVRAYRRITGTNRPYALSLQSELSGSEHVLN